MAKTVADRLVERLIDWGVDTIFGLPGRQVVCLAGDGGFSMLMAEMPTLVKYNLPVKVVIFKNNTFGMIE